MSETSFPNENSASGYCAFLCDNDGKVIRDFGEQLPCSSESVSASSVLAMIESGGLTDFLEAFHTHRATLGWERMIHHEGSASTLVLHGSQTPCGILVFGYSTPRPATLQNDRAAAFAAVTDSKTRSAADEDAANLMFTVVHDLKNPISSIISSCEYLREYSQENLNPAQLEIIAGIESSASTLLQLSARLFELGFAGNDDANSQGPGSSP